MLPLADGDAAFGTEFAHTSSAWRDLAPTVCYLSEQHRQSDTPFLELLAAIRANACAGIHRERLSARLIEKDRLPEGCTRLFTHNAAVDEINQQQLAKLGGEMHSSSMVAKGPEPFVQALKRGCLSPETLALKKGATVMFTKNDQAGRYVNGTLGVVEGFDPDDGHPVVVTRGGKRIVAEPATWKIDEGGRERASITQIPLRLAWAMTVHKSQGMSLDAAVIDLSRAFEFGQGARRPRLRAAPLQGTRRASPVGRRRFWNPPRRARHRPSRSSRDRPPTPKPTRWPPLGKPTPRPMRPGPRPRRATSSGVTTRARRWPPSPTGWGGNPARYVPG
jgi:hypothetical protein